MTDRYAVVGNPISHSKSPLIHAAFARQTDQDLSYEAMLAPLDGFAPCVSEFRRDGGKGLNVTVPFKVDAWKLATRLSERARLAQAVNALQFEPGEQIFGDNTDGAGLVRDIVHNLGFPLEGKKILLMGAGGAARGVLLPLLENRPASIFIVNRTAARAVELQHQFTPYGAIAAGSYEALSGASFDVVINATSSGLADQLPPLPEGLFAPAALAYDMMYGKETPFLSFAREQGAEVVADGLGMLVEQAAEAFLLWRGVRPATQPVIEMLRG